MPLEQTLICAFFQILSHKKKKPVTKAHPTSKVSKDLGPKVRSAVQAYPFKDRLSSTASNLVHQWDAVLTGCARGAPLENKQRPFARPYVLPAPASPTLPSNMLGEGGWGGCVWRTATEPLQGGSVDCGPPAARHFKRQRGAERTCTTHQGALRHVLLWEYISSNIKLQARSNTLETRLKLPQSEYCTHALSADDLD